MRPMFYIACFLALIGLGSWAYRENYATQQAMRDLAAVQDEIGLLSEALAVQRAEWAYLNRPDRLRELVTLNYDRLGLLPMEPAQFGAARDISYPAPDAMLQTDPQALGGGAEAALALAPVSQSAEQVLP